jgi:hypothetical protein
MDSRMPGGQPPRGGRLCNSHMRVIVMSVCFVYLFIFPSLSWTGTC